MVRRGWEGAEHNSQMQDNLACNVTLIQIRNAVRAREIKVVQRFSDGKSRSTFLRYKITKYCIVLFAYFLWMLMAVMLLSWSHVPLWILLWKCFDAYKGAEIPFRMRQLHIQTIKCHGDPFDACSLPSRLCYFLWQGSLLLDHLIGLDYPRRKTWCCLHVVVA